MARNWRLWKAENLIRLYSIQKSHRAFVSNRRKLTLTQHPHTLAWASYYHYQWQRARAVSCVERCFFSERTKMKILTKGSCLKEHILSKRWLTWPRTSFNNYNSIFFWLYYPKQSFLHTMEYESQIVCFNQRIYNMYIFRKN